MGVLGQDTKEVLGLMLGLGRLIMRTSCSGAAGLRSVPPYLTHYTNFSSQNLQQNRLRSGRLLSGKLV